MRLQRDASEREREIHGNLTWKGMGSTYITGKREANGQFGRKMNPNVGGNRNLFWEAERR